MSTTAYGFVAIKEEVYLKIAEAVLTNANPWTMEPSEFKEVIGFLGGRVVVGNCKVNECHISHIGTNTEVQLEPKHYIMATDWESQLYMKDPPEFMIGWWHSHFIGHTFSGVDILNHLGWQNENHPHAIGLVFDPQLISKDNPGFTILRLDDPNLGEASEINHIDFTVQMSSEKRENYLAYLKKNLSQLFSTNI